LSPRAPLACVPVGVVVERRKAVSPWADYLWRPVAVLSGVPDTAPWTVIATEPETVTFYAGGAEVALHRSETANYRGNLLSGSPSLWVVLRAAGAEPPYEVMLVTADPAEGEAMTEAGSDIVEAVPMPEPLRQILHAFVAEHHVERAFHKRQRDEADPEAFTRHQPAPGARQK
jgi:hypothetical protein